MSVLIRGMEMPKNCSECRMWCICDCLNDFEDYESICYAVEDGDLVRDKNCPLIEIPTPHGRLGDLDKLKYDIVVGNQKYLGLNAPCLEDVTPIENVDDCIDAIAFAPTVIEAEWRE